MKHGLTRPSSEILAFNDALAQFKELNTAVLGMHIHVTSHSFPRLRHSTAVSTDSKYSHFAWATQDRKEGGLGPDLALPLVADRNMSISRDYGVLLEEEGIALRGLFIIDPKGILRYVFITLYSLPILTLLRQITVNDLPVGRSVDETLRLIKAFQFTVSPSSSWALVDRLNVLSIRTSTVRSALPTGLRDPRPSKPTPSPSSSSSDPPLTVPLTVRPMVPPDQSVPESTEPVF